MSIETIVRAILAVFIGVAVWMWGVEFGKKRAMDRAMERAKSLCLKTMELDEAEWDREFREIQERLRELEEERR